MFRPSPRGLRGRLPHKARHNRHSAARRSRCDPPTVSAYTCPGCRSCVLLASIAIEPWPLCTRPGAPLSTQTSLETRIRDRGPSREDEETLSHLFFSASMNTRRRRSASFDVLRIANRTRKRHSSTLHALLLARQMRAPTAPAVLVFDSPPLFAASSCSPAPLPRCARIACAHTLCEHSVRVGCLPISYIWLESRHASSNTSREPAPFSPPCFLGSCDTPGLSPACSPCKGRRNQELRPSHTFGIVGP